jgi:hypothetical protein
MLRYLHLELRRAEAISGMRGIEEIHTELSLGRVLESES